MHRRPRYQRRTSIPPSHHPDRDLHHDPVDLHDRHDHHHLRTWNPTTQRSTCSARAHPSCHSTSDRPDLSRVPSPRPGRPNDTPPTRHPETRQTRSSSRTCPCPDLDPYLDPSDQTPFDLDLDTGRPHVVSSLRNPSVLVLQVPIQVPIQVPKTA